MQSRVSESMAEPRLYTGLLGTFAFVALLLTGIGVYGVVSYSVNSRTREFGIRMALGARSGDVLRFVMERGLRLVLPGVAIGVAGAWTLSRFLESLLFDPLAFAAGPVVLIVVAVAGCYVPARRATKVDPQVALRTE